MYLTFKVAGDVIIAIATTSRLLWCSDPTGLVESLLCCRWKPQPMIRRLWYRWIACTMLDVLALHLYAILWSHLCVYFDQNRDVILVDKRRHFGRNLNDKQLVIPCKFSASVIADGVCRATPAQSFKSIRSFEHWLSWFQFNVNSNSSIVTPIQTYILGSLASKIIGNLDINNNVTSK